MKMTPSRSNVPENCLQTYHGFYLYANIHRKKGDLDSV